MTFAFFAVFFACTIGCFLIFDLVIKTQYRECRDEWVKDGMPHGFFFNPKETSTIFGMPRIRSWIAMQVRLFALLFATPGWIEPHSNLKGYIWLFRLLQLVALACWVGILIATLS